MGVARVYTPKDYRLSVMMRDLAELARTTPIEASGRGCVRPMRKRMHDPRVIVAATGGVAALAAGAIGVAINSPTFAVVAGSAGVVAAIAGVALGARARQSEDRLEQAEDEIRAVRRELASINAVLQEEASRRVAEEELGSSLEETRRARRAGVRRRDRPLRREVLRGARATAGCGGPAFAAPDLGHHLRDRRDGRLRPRHALAGARRRR